jgi:hypothetical protein
MASFDISPNTGLCSTCDAQLDVDSRGRGVCYNETPEEGKVGNCPVDGVLVSDEGRHPWSPGYRHGSPRPVRRHNSSPFLVV